MKGNLLKFSIESDTGIISGDDGNRYTFSSADWQDKKRFPQGGMQVDFEIDDQKAVNIYFLSTESLSISVVQNKNQSSFKQSILRFIPRKKLYIGAAIVSIISLGLGATYGGFYLVELNQANACRNQTKESVDSISEEWDDAMSRASKTSRISLQPVISDLQNIKRRASDNQWHPCANFAKVALRLGMESDIDQLLEFMGGSDIPYQKSPAWSIFANDLSLINEHGKSEHPANSEEAAKDTLKNVLQAKIDELDKKLEPLNNSYAEYKKQDDDLSGQIELVSTQIEAVPSVDYSLPYQEWDAAKAQREAQLEPLQSHSSNLRDQQSALMEQYGDVINQRQEIEQQKRYLLIEMARLETLTF
jgi:hypothetical protein